MHQEMYWCFPPSEELIRDTDKERQGQMKRWIRHKRRREKDREREGRSSRCF